MALLNKQQISDADDIPTELIRVPEWDAMASDGKAEVRIRGLSGTERDKYEQSLVRMRNGAAEPNVADATARLCAWCMIDETGSRLFIGEDEVKELGKKSAAAIQRVFAVASRLSGLTVSEVEGMTQGFGNGPSESSTTD